MQTLTHDVIINGAGPAGSTLALMLASKAENPKRIALIGELTSSNNDSNNHKTIDPRTLALNHGSRSLLKSLKAWPKHSANINTVHVSQRGRMGRTIINSSDLNVPSLGSVVSYDNLLITLHKQLQESGISIIQTNNAPWSIGQNKISAVTPGGLINAHVAVVSHGGAPKGMHRTYNQSAVLAIIKASLGKPTWAYERFTKQGPLALLPHPQGNAHYAMVWCCPPDQAQHLSKMPTHNFNNALQKHFGDRLGSLQCVGQRHVFSLALHAGPHLLNSRTVAIGNAAQTLHPVAGQGLNLGLRDVAQLGIALTPWLANTGSDVTDHLKKFANNRRTDRAITMGTTDILPRIFSTGNSILEHGCGLSLLALDTLPSARNILALQLLQGLRI